LRHSSTWQVRKLARICAIACSLALSLGLGGCSQFLPDYLKPLSPQASNVLSHKEMSWDSPILIRIFKSEAEMEIWKQKDDGRFHLFKTYEICRFSGKLGPKRREGDRQAPEGFYTVAEKQMNPWSRNHLAFNIGYPNTFDRAHGRTGSLIMVHGGCSSIGCYAMTDEAVQDIYALSRDAFEGGQEAFQIQAYPFRMTDENMAKHRKDKWFDFWANLKEGYDYFETTHLEPKVDVCGKRYMINVAFTDEDAEVDPRKDCPAYRPLPVIPHTKSLQVAVPKGPPPRPLGEAFGLAFGPKEPTYHMFSLGPAVTREN
jgi:murein L,D-transpeptidase YafK